MEKENISIVNRLEDVYGINNNDKYIVKFTDNTIIKGTVLNFYPAGQIAIKTDEGLVINQVINILEMKPIKEGKGGYKVDDEIQLKNILVQQMINPQTFVGDLLCKNIEGVVCSITDKYIYFEDYEGAKYRVEKKRL
ncbi:MAG: hypothetical protein ACRCVJ_18510 [Clostridium sp.]|uniref:hypothetical protein n=1 Tax=Clostridium sp. TaxID=1506 RepID=UPI003F3C2CCB